MGFEHIYGNERIISNLKRSISEGRLSHSYIFYGKNGIGKFQVALSISAALNCKSSLYREMGDFCGTCSSCKRVFKRSHPALHILERDRDSKVIKIENVRELQAKIEFRLLEGERRVIIVNSAETMNIEAMNCFLKTLEEPPDGCVIILITSSLNSLLPTIRSRCQKVRFKDIPAEEIKKILMNNSGATEEEADLISRLSMGSIGKAFEIQRLFTNLKDLRDLFLSNIEKVVRGERSVVEAAEETLKWGDTNLLDFIQIFELLVRDLILYKYSKREDDIINIDKVDAIERILSITHEDSLFDLFDSFKSIRRGYELNVSPQTLIENAYINLKER